MSTQITASGQILGATLAGFDLAQPLRDRDYQLILRALGEHGVIRFPGQRLSARQLADFSARFGDLEINVANADQEAGVPEVMILSNIVVAGKPIGLADAALTHVHGAEHRAVLDSALSPVLYPAARAARVRAKEAVTWPTPTSRSSVSSSTISAACRRKRLSARSPLRRARRSTASASTAGW